MNVLILMRILIGIGVLDHPASGLRFQNDPIAVAFLEIVSDLHACALGRAVLGPEFDPSVRLIPVDRNAANIHFHGADVERAYTRQVLHDAGADGIAVALLFLAPAGGNERGGKPKSQGQTFHANVLSNSNEIVSHRLGLQSIAHEESDANVKNGKDSEGITKGPMDDVPELKDLLGARKVQDALGER